MRCPFCQKSDTQVIETRNADEGFLVRRRRQCIHCTKRFTTYEKTEISFPAVIKSNGNRVDYSHDKLKFSIKIALRKRPVTTEQVDQAILRIEQQLLSMATKEVTSQKIGDLVMAELKQLDLVGYVRFASVYKSFVNIDEFNQLVADMNKTTS